ncbi:MAG: phosphoketolase [Candidatus Dojkabacteria bacterium]
MPAQPDYITEELMIAMSKYLRLTNYIGGAQLYLKDNFLLEDPLDKKHIKERLLGHWGTVPGINFMYACLNVVIKNLQQEMMLITGPGHGYPALLANLFVEGSLGEYYPEYKISKTAFEGLIKQFSWPGGFPSHANPETPGVIHEGGELGYALATAFGAAFDNPDLIVACIVGDGEAETGPTATAWHSNKFLNPVSDGGVLPILHLNKYKISGPTIFSSMTGSEISNLFKGYGYDPIIVDGDILYETMLTAVHTAVEKIRDIQNRSRGGENIERPEWPMIVLVSKKGWTGPKELKGLPIEDSFRSHGIPLEHVHQDDEEFNMLEDWLRSYKVQELFTDKFELIDEIKSLIPPPKLRLGMTRHGNGGNVRVPLNLPKLEDLEVKVDGPGQTTSSNMKLLGSYLRETVRGNPNNFRIMSPDETESNKLHALFEVTTRRYMWPVPFGSENIGRDGRVMEILSEHTLQGWLQGYLLTGRHGIFISYEAFMMIVASMVDQYSKFLKQMRDFKWRTPLPSLNFVLTSTSWRQDHNGFSHQNPGFISSVLNDYSQTTNVHFPVDGNMLMATMEEIFDSTNTVNILVVGKRGLPQYLNMKQAKEQIKSGITRWEWAGNNDEDPDVVFVATGDYPTQESLAAIKILKEIIPKLSTRFIAVSELTCFGIGDNHNTCRINLDEFEKIFTKDKQIIYSYHGYPEDIQQLIFRHPAAPRFHIHGYTEKGTTTTPFDMQVQNEADRYHLAMQAVDFASDSNVEVKARAEEIKAYLSTILKKHKSYIQEHGNDIPEVREFSL